jgi:hypothetical protein
MGDQSALGDGIPTYHDSQITSQNALPPIYSSGITFQQALHLWKEADDANKTLPEKESFLLHLKEELDNQRPLAEELKTKRYDFKSRILYSFPVHIIHKLCTRQLQIVQEPESGQPYVDARAFSKK